MLAALVASFAALSAAATLLGIGLLPLIGIAAGVVLGVGALAAAGYLIYTKWDGIAGWFGEVWAEIKGYFSGGIAGISAFLVNFSPMGLLYGGIAKLLSWLGIDVTARLSQVGAFMIQGLINGISSKWAELKSKIVGLASAMPDWVRKVLGIHSPSRVFAAIGGHVMAGLDQGLADNSSNPLARFTDLSGQMTRALAVGASSAAIAAASPSAAQSPASQSGYPMAGAPPSAPATYNLHFHGVTGEPQDIADAVRDALEKFERDRRARGFGDD